AEFAATLPDLEAALRSAQAAGNAQRSAVAGVQQQIQVLAAEARSVQEQQRQLENRRERLATESCQLAEPDPARLHDLQGRVQRADEAKQAADAAAAALGQEVPALD